MNKTNKLKLLSQKVYKIFKKIQISLRLLLFISIEKSMSRYFTRKQSDGNVYIRKLHILKLNRNNNSWKSYN
jgi:hypothetical protein